ncbi:transporter [Sphingomonas sp. Leaf339]|nr:transporter [Sphingomonas sp. Leaf339]
MRRLAFLALTLAGLFWGLGFPFGKLVLREVMPAHMVLLRFAVASMASIPFAFGSAEARALFRSPAVLGAGALYGIAFLIQFEGLAGVTVTLAALLVGAMPALVALAARLTGEEVTRTSWIGVAAATIGAALIAGKPGGAGSAAGIALSLLSLLVFLAWLMVSKRAPTVRSALAVPSVMLIVATITVAPVAVAMRGLPPVNLSAVAWLGIVGQGLLSTFVATVAWQYGAARVDSASAGIFINIEPLIGALIGITLFEDPVGLPVLIGGLGIVVGSIIVVRGELTVAPSSAADAIHGLSLD